MNDCVIPGLDSMKVKTLYVIGNGFDIAHGIESKYSDFKEWVEKNKNRRIVDMMDIFFSNERELWCDVETALGEYNEDTIIEYCKPEEEFDYDHPTRSEAGIVDSPDSVFKPILDEFLDSFIDWVNSISLNEIEKLPKLGIDKDSTYLTFNYTETLEKIYEIPEDNVFHIHGSRLDSNQYVMGHSNLKALDSSYEESDFYFMNDTREKIISWMNELHKDTTSIIEHNNNFFDSLCGIEQVIVLGHSLYAVDIPYFEEIHKNVKKDALWIFSYYDNDDVKRITDFVSKIRINNFKLVDSDSIFN